MILVSLGPGYHLKLLRIDRLRLDLMEKVDAITKRDTVQTSVPRGGNKFHREILPGLQLIIMCGYSPMKTGIGIGPVSILLALQLDD